MKSISESGENKNKTSFFVEDYIASDSSIPEYITAKSGLKVRVADSEWRLLHNKGKGNILNLSWLRGSNLKDRELQLTLLVFIYYAINKAASTTATVSIGIRPVINSGFPSVLDLTIMWSGLSISKKKLLISFSAHY